VTSRKRVLATLDHRELDRIPIDLGSTIAGSIAKNAYVDLERYLATLGLCPRQVLWQPLTRQPDTASTSRPQSFEVNSGRLCLVVLA
jgi:hypothetical protein